MDECHDANDDAKEAGQEGEDHEGAGGIEVGCGQDHRSTEVTSEVSRVNDRRRRTGLKPGRAC